MKDVINQMFVDRNVAATYWLGGTIAVLYLVKGLASYGQETTMARIGKRDHRGRADADVHPSPHPAA